MKSILATIGAGILVLGVWTMFEKLGEWFMRLVDKESDFEHFDDKFLAFMIGLLIFSAAALIIILLYCIGIKVILPVFE